MYLVWKQPENDRPICAGMYYVKLHKFFGIELLFTLEQPRRISESVLSRLQ